MKRKRKFGTSQSGPHASGQTGMELLLHFQPGLAKLKQAVPRLLPQEECGWAAEGVPVMSLSSLVCPFPTLLCIYGPSCLSPKDQAEELLGQANAAIPGASGNGFSFGIKAGPMTAWGEGIVTTVNV